MARKMLWLLVVLVLLAGCGNDTNDVTDTGVEEFDDVVEDGVDALEEGIGKLCAACTLVNGAGSDSCQGVCD